MAKTKRKKKQQQEQTHHLPWRTDLPPKMQKLEDAARKRRYERKDRIHELYDQGCSCGNPSHRKGCAYREMLDLYVGELSEKLRWNAMYDAGMSYATIAEFRRLPPKSQQDVWEGMQLEHSV